MANDVRGARQVNLLLELLVVTAIATGLLSWAVTDRWSGWCTDAHAVAGLALVVLVPAKLRGPVAAGFRRRRRTRWVSAAFGCLTLVTAALGVAHATGAWFGVGQWSPLWTHELLAFLLVPLFVWHLRTRPVRLRRTDLDRRAVLRGGAVLGGAVVLHRVQQGAVDLAGLAGADRRFTGSHETGSHRPAAMPTVEWFDDRRPSDTDAASWRLVVAGERVPIADLRARARPVTAVLDCTGGWWSEQAWDAVPLRALLPRPEGRSVKVESATGYFRLFPHGALDDVHLAIGYGGEALRPGHGAPVRLVVPGRRGPWWVKWVTSIEPDDRPSWFQWPLPLS